MSAPEHARLRTSRCRDSNFRAVRPRAHVRGLGPVALRVRPAWVRVWVAGAVRVAFDRPRSSRPARRARHRRRRPGAARCPRPTGIAHREPHVVHALFFERRHEAAGSELDGRRLHRPTRTIDIPPVGRDRLGATGDADTTTRPAGVEVDDEPIGVDVGVHVLVGARRPLVPRAAIPIVLPPGEPGTSGNGDVGDAARDPWGCRTTSRARLGHRADPDRHAQGERHDDGSGCSSRLGGSGGSWPTLLVDLTFVDCSVTVRTRLGPLHRNGIGAASESCTH